MDLVNGTRSKNRLRGPHSSHQPSGMRIESRNIAVRSDECGSDSSEVRGVARVPEPPSLQSLGESIAIMEEEEKGEEEEARRREGREVTHEVFGPVLAGCTPAGGVQDGFTSLGTHEHPSLPRPTTLSTSGSPATVFPGPSPSPTYSPESPSILTQTGRPCELASGSETPSRPPADLSGPIRSATTEGGNGGGSSGMEEVSFPSLAVATKGTSFAAWVITRYDCPSFIPHSGMSHLWGVGHRQVHQLSSRYLPQQDCSTAGIHKPQVHNCVKVDFRDTLYHLDFVV